MQDNTVAAIAIVCIFGGPVAAWIVMRVLKHQERMEMLRRGIVPPPEFNKNAYNAWRRAGSPWPPPGAGPAPQAAPWTPQPAPAPWTTPEDDPQRALFKGIRLALIGFAITVGLGMAFHRGNPVILGGLIPMFVGIAQIIIAVLSGAQLPGVAPHITFMPPPPQPPPGTPPPPPHNGFGTVPPPPPWAEQPGRQRFEELSKPAPPPDVR